MMLSEAFTSVLGSGFWQGILGKALLFFSFLSIKLCLQGCCSSHQSIIYLPMTQTGEVKTHPISHAIPSKSLKFQKDCVCNFDLSQWFKKLSLLLCSMSAITWLRLATGRRVIIESINSWTRFWNLSQEHPQLDVEPLILCWKLRYCEDGPLCLL